MSDADVARTPSTRCSRCERELDAASSARQFDGPPRPRPGDISMCLYCGTFHTWGKRMQLKRMTFAQIAALDADTRALFRRMQRARRAVMGEGSDCE